MTTEIVTQEWFRGLLEDCKAIIVTRGYQARMEVISCYHELGLRIIKEYGNFERHKIYGQKIVQVVAQSLGKGQRSIQYAVQFAKMFPDINGLPPNMNISWSAICKELLPKTREECPHDLFEEMIIRVCKKCNKRIDNKGHHISSDKSIRM